MPKYCLDCGTNLIAACDADPNGDMGSRCAKCLAEYRHDFDAEPLARFGRDGHRLPDDSDPALDKAFDELTVKLAALAQRPHGFILNPVLVKKQKISKRTERWILGSHRVKAALFDAMRLTQDPHVLRGLAKAVEELEFHQQDLWGFPLDRNFHYWWRVPGCRCPQMDNDERYGTKYGIVSGACPIHGGSE